MVVLLHVAAILQPCGFDDHWVSFGGRGVDLFFVISGYVMVYTTSRNPVSGGAFFLNRVFRVVPLYWLVTLPLGIAAILAPTLLRSFKASPETLLASLAFIPYRDTAGHFFPVLFVGWTLDYEMFFYAMFAIALIATNRSAKRTAIATLVALFAISTVGLAVRDQAPWLTFYTDSIILEFGFGMLLALLVEQNFVPSRRYSLISAIGGFVVLIAAAAICPQIPRVIASGLPAAFIIWGAVGLELSGQVARTTWIQTLGAASYALYLIHPIITSGFHRVVIAIPSLLVAIVAAVSALLIAVMGAVALHVLVERPLLRFLRRLAGHRPALIQKFDPSTELISTESKKDVEKQAAAKG